MPALILVMLLQLSGAQTGRSMPLWVSRNTDPALWRAIRTAFKEELVPDDPKKVGPTVVPMTYKYVARIAEAEGVCLVIIGQRASKQSPPYDGFFAYSYDRRSGQKTLITSRSVSGWRSLQWTSFEQGTHPDLLFKHSSCYECEAEYYISSLFFDSSSRTWQMRKWPKDGDATSIVVGTDWSVGTNDNSRMTCLFRVAAFPGDTSAALAVWCQEVFEDRRTAKETLSLYSVVSGRPLRREPAPTGASSVKQVLCRGRQSYPLCRQRP
jgi:hypothetical protein